MKDPKFYNANGDLSWYSFKCGYVQKSENEKRWKKMYMEHEHFHVMSGPIENGEHVCYTTWEVFEGNELTKARKLYKSL